MHQPWIAAITGFVHDATHVIARCRRWIISNSFVRSRAPAPGPTTAASSGPIPPRSRPWLNASPSPRMMITRTSSFASSAANSAGISFQNAGPIRLALPCARRRTSAV